MITPTGIPVTIEPEAAEYVGELELRPVLGKILESTTQIFPDLRRFAVKLETGCEDNNVLRVIVELIVSADFALGGNAMLRFMEWVVANLPPQEWQYFGVWRDYEPNHGK